MKLYLMTYYRYGDELVPLYCTYDEHYDFEFYLKTMVKAFLGKRNSFLPKLVGLGFNKNFTQYNGTPISIRFNENMDNVCEVNLYYTFETFHHHTVDNKDEQNKQHIDEWYKFLVTYNKLAPLTKDTKLTIEEVKKGFISYCDMHLDIFYENEKIRYENWQNFHDDPFYLKKI